MKNPFRFGQLVEGEDFCNRIKELKEISVPIEKITTRIYLIRGQKVMLDRDLAELYEVETKQLKRAVRRNIDRFPADFMFELTKAELENWRCQFDTSNYSIPLESSQT